ncbi:uncharacterized protein LOC143181766 [Calliopsis andreniformis]|uniref:uncharacterized protein LOC143181766 n=1 Tax=Calliopsis andreniformis TaxID=337506 RepID=UPI003FCE7403
MILYTKPRILILNERKIHVCRKPGLLAWSLLTLSLVICIEISRHLTKNDFYSIILLFGEIMFNLEAFGEWQDLLLDKDQNNAVIEKHTWIDKLCCYKTSHGSHIVMQLTDIRHVGVSVEMGLFILHENGRTISLSMQGFTREELQKLRRKISYFLNSK